MLEIGFDDASKLAGLILTDEFQCDPILFWEEWEIQFLLLYSINRPWTNQVLSDMKDLFRCSRNICSLGVDYQDTAKYYF